MRHGRPPPPQTVTCFRLFSRLCTKLCKHKPWHTTTEAPGQSSAGPTNRAQLTSRCARCAFQQGRGRISRKARAAGPRRGTTSSAGAAAGWQLPLQSAWAAVRLPTACFTATAALSPSMSPWAAPHGTGAMQQRLGRCQTTLCSPARSEGLAGEGPGGLLCCEVLGPWHCRSLHPHRCSLCLIIAPQHTVRPNKKE